MDLDFTGQITTVRLRCLEATASMLGDTIGLSETEWLGPSLVPGWSRAHVAAHVSANAEALRRVLTEDSRAQPLYQTADQKYSQIHRGAELSPLELQIQLDTTASRLDAAFDSVSNWQQPIWLGTRGCPAHSVPLLRLREVTVHHLDLNTGFSPLDIPPVPARWLLQLAITDLAERPELPAVELASDSGVTGLVGAAGDRRSVSGSDADLWGWLMGRTSDSRLAGADGLRFPISP